jgi:serine/threonine protein kinase
VRKGQVIHGYRVLQDFSTAGSGLSKWTYAEKGGQTYFLKEFLSPTYPVDGSPGSAETRARKKQACEAFETRMQGLITAVNGTGPAGGNLITTAELFREGARYYKATAWVEIAPLAVTDVAGLPLARRLLILLTIAHSLRILHAANIVHGDLRPENVLLKQTITGDYAAKLIDFDSSYFSGTPPPRHEMVGDPIYYAPEVGRYIEVADGADASCLTTQSDIFSLGLVYAQYLTGRLPSFSREKYRYAYVAAGNGGRLTLQSKGLPPGVGKLVRSMLSPDPARRPDIQGVFTRLKDPTILKAKRGKDIEAEVERAPTPVEADTEKPASPKKGGGKVKGTLAVKTGADELLPPVESLPVEEVPVEEGRSSKLKGTLLTRREEAA